MTEIECCAWCGKRPKPRTFGTGYAIECEGCSNEIISTDKADAINTWNSLNGGKCVCPRCGWTFFKGDES